MLFSLIYFRTDPRKPNILPAAKKSQGRLLGDERKMQGRGCVPRESPSCQWRERVGEAELGFTGMKDFGDSQKGK